MSRKNSQRAERKQQRLSRLPPFARGLISDRAGRRHSSYPRRSAWRSSWLASLLPPAWACPSSMPASPLSMTRLASRPFQTRNLNTLCASRSRRMSRDLAMIARRDLGNAFAHETGDGFISVCSNQASEGGPMTDSIALLRACSNKSLAKIWATDWHVTPAAYATWFQGEEIVVGSLQEFAAYSTCTKSALASPGQRGNRAGRRCEPTAPKMFAGRR